MPAERTILDFLDRVLPGLFVGPTWAPWLAVVKAAFALPLTDAERELFVKVADREPPAEPVTEVWACVGRRGGKSQVAALLAVYLATCRSFPLAPGERGILPIIAADRRQARVVHGYVLGLLKSTPVLENMIVRELAESIELNNRITIEIHTASYKSIRGYTIVSAIGDEVAFWPSNEDAAEPDKEILNALRPAMATIPGALLLCLSTPYAKRGELFRAVERYHGEPGDVLVIRAPTETMNPAIPQKVLDRAFERDPVAAMSEYGKDGAIEFRPDVAALLAEGAIQAVTPAGVLEIPPDAAVVSAEKSRQSGRGIVPRVGTLASHVAHFDAATGSGKDSAALAIARKGQPAQLMALRHWRPPFNPGAAIREAAELCRSYGVASITIDRYAPGLVAELFREHGITCTVTDHDTAGAFLELLSAINAKRVRLLDDPRLLSELRRLERRPGSGDRERVGHPPGGHDDLAAAAAGALIAAARKPKLTSVVWGRDRNNNRTGEPSLRRQRLDRLRWADGIAAAHDRASSRVDANPPIPDRLATYARTPGPASTGRSNPWGLSGPASRGPATLRNTKGE